MIKSARISNARAITANSNVTSIPGLVAWYESTLPESFDAGKGIVDSSSIGYWYDISPYSYKNQANILSPLAGAGPIYTADAINGVPALLFPYFSNIAVMGISQLYQGSLPITTIFIVLKPTMPPSPYFGVLDSYSTNTHLIALKSSAVTLNAGNSIDTGSTNAANFDTGTIAIIAAYFNGSNSGVYINNFTTLTGGANINPGNTSLVGLQVGVSTLGFSDNFCGYIGEIIIYDRALNLAERKDVMTYLSKKYNIALTNY